MSDILVKLAHRGPGELLKHVDHFVRLTKGDYLMPLTFGYTVINGVGK